MTNERTEDQRDKQEKRRKRTLAGIFERKGAKHRNPCNNRNWSGITGAPGLVEPGQHGEGQCRDQAHLGKRPYGIAEFDFATSLDDTFEIDRVDDHQNAKQNGIQEYLVAGDPKCRHVTVCTVIYQASDSQAGSEDP